MPRFRLLAPLMDLLPYPNEGALRDALAPAAGEGAVLVDLGGGTGRVTRFVQDRFGTCVVADLQPAMLRRVPPPVQAVLADGARLPLADGSVDAVLTTDAFHHFAEQARVLEEVRRVLRPGGVLVLEEFDPAHWQTKGIMVFERLARFGSTFRAPDELRAMVEAAGFRDVEVRRFSGRDYAAVARAP